MSEHAPVFQEIPVEFRAVHCSPPIKGGVGCWVSAGFGFQQAVYKLMETVFSSILLAIQVYMQIACDRG